MYTGRFYDLGIWFQERKGGTKSDTLLRMWDSVAVKVNVTLNLESTSQGRCGTGTPGQGIPKSWRPGARRHLQGTVRSP